MHELVLPHIVRILHSGQDWYQRVEPGPFEHLSGQDVRYDAGLAVDRIGNASVVLHREEGPLHAPGQKLAGHCRLHYDHFRRDHGASHRLEHSLQHSANLGIHSRLPLSWRGNHQIRNPRASAEFRSRGVHCSG